MNPAPLVPPGDPLVVGTSGMPVLYSTLGAYFQLESLTPEDVEVLEAVNGLVKDWFGEELRWTGTSVFHNVRPFAPDDLELISCHALQLARGSPVAGAPPDVLLTYAQEDAARIDEFEVAMHGGPESGSPWPYAYRFYAIIPEFKPQAHFSSAAMLRITVPDRWPLDDFLRRVSAIAATLRLRWGAAGFMYSGWEYYQYNTTQRAVYAHARRFPGYDTGYYDRPMLEWHGALRTVNWLTFLGPELAAALKARGSPLRSTPRVQVVPAGANVMLRAGETPERGDTNRLYLPRAYVEADEMIRPVRARSCLNFGRPWTEQSTQDWLQRFEKRLRP
ncbi:hypothetical protein BE04_24720 [Sorangium cellulosum]|uniref:DUF3396 domain-containing protein n=1 Tax=Sorangium cellulosum TaxID=56 RepID=A0A150P2R2_SORCE|nr:hypothetical protein BE04_24720 [Sorangium cellulosum]